MDSTECEKSYWFRYDNKLYNVVELERMTSNCAVKIKLKDLKHTCILIPARLKSIDKSRLLHNMIKGRKLTDLNGRKIHD